MAFAIPAAAIIGAGVSAYSAIQSGNASAANSRFQQSSSTYQAQVAKNNELIANQNADYAEEAGTAQAQAVALKGRAVGGRIKANQAASGIDVNTGSAVDVQEAQHEGAQLDTETVLNNADLKAYGYRSQGANFAAESTLDTLTAGQAGRAASSAETGGYLKAAGGLLSSAGSIGGKWSGGLGTPGPITEFPAQPEDI